MEKNKKTSGITLIALVVTIVVLIILATISIYAVLGENGLIARAERAREADEQSKQDEQNGLDNYTEYIDSKLPYEMKLPKGPNGKPLVSGVKTTEHDTITGEDEKGNQVVVPGRFKVAEDSAKNVQEGIVVEDEKGNQFVWIPVSNINHDGSNKIKLKDNSEVEITLGRYTFDESTGAETLQQMGADYTQIVTVCTYYQELDSFSESNQKGDLTGTNTTAKDLKGFIESVRDNKGYYIARYEASYASGSEFGVGNDSKYYKPASKVSTANSTSAMNYSEGTLWNFITQGNASKASRQMYYGNSYIESDLINGYAWDTAIVYIQAMGNSNYANATRGTNTVLKNTGETEDEKCKIFDMAGNLYEFSTEYATFFTEGGRTFPCTSRGGGYFNGSNNRAGNRYLVDAPYSYADYSFRIILYL